jgi:hypothetical protein
MQLLYCLNGQVLGWHDSAQNIPASAYPAGTFVIPYAQSLATLPRIGTLPPPPWKASYGDPRPYAQPTETPQLLIAYAAQVRFDKSTKGFSFAAASGAVPVDCDRVSQTLVGNLANYAATLAPTTVVDFTQGGVHYTLTAAEVKTMFDQMQNRIQQARTIESQCIADLNLATPTIKTYADVDTRFAGL